MNAVAQLVASVILGKVQPGTIPGLLFMMPASLWVILATGGQYGWLPVVIGPVLSVPVLIAVWWLAAMIEDQR